MLGQYLKKFRLTNNLSQREMAAKIGTSQSYYSRIESGVKKPGIRIINKISETLGQEPSTIRSMLW